MKLPINSSSGTTLSRMQVIQILNAALKMREVQFARNLSSSWLEEFPGDLAVNTFYSQTMILNNQPEKAVSILEKIVKLDPEFYMAQRLLAMSASKFSYPEIGLVRAQATALGGKFPQGVQVPNWGTALLHANLATQNNESKNAEGHIQSALLAKSNSPLPSIFHLKYARSNYEWRATQKLLELYAQQWPDSLFFKLVQVEFLIDRGDDQTAVSILHEIVCDDLGGQIPQRYWGEDHDYKSLWPIDMHIELDFPIPASVTRELGLNGLGNRNSRISGKSQETESSKKKGNNNRIINNPNRSSTKNQEPESLLSIQDELKKIALRLKKPHLNRADSRFPVYVILTSRHGLIKKYGAANVLKIEELIQEVANTTEQLSNWNAAIAYVDSAEDSARVGITPVNPSDPWEIKNYISDLDKSFSRTGQMIGALLIVGGQDVVPFHKLPNPVDDIDIDIPSDNPYASLDEDYFIPSIPIGRLPGVSGDDPNPILKSLQSIVDSRKRILKRKKSFGELIRKILSLFRLSNSVKTNFGYTAQIWQRASHSVFRIIGDRRGLAISPPTFAQRLPKRATDSVDLGYYNLHGLEDSAEWYGQRDPTESTRGPDYPVALRPQDVLNSGRAPQIVFTEACYGAHVINKTTETALSLKFLSAGTKVVIGSTCMSYGSIATPLIAADLLGQAFWKLLKEGHPAGEALRRSKIHLAKEMHRRQGYLDGEDQKTLIQFVLYGDPLAQPENLASQPEIYQRFSNPQVKTICDKVNGTTIKHGKVPDDVLVQVKGLVKNYLPGMAKSKVMYSEEHVDCVGHSCPNQTFGEKGHPNQVPGRRVVTLSKQVRGEKHNHPHFARVTLDTDGKVVKLAVSR